MSRAACLTVSVAMIVGAAGFVAVGVFAKPWPFWGLGAICLLVSVACRALRSRRAAAATKRFLDGRLGRRLLGEIAHPAKGIGAAGMWAFGRLYRASERLHGWADELTAAGPPRSPWWARRRWIAAGLFWVLLAYPLSVGPLSYAEGRGWLAAPPPSGLVTFYGPVRYALEHRLPLSGLLRSYGSLCQKWGREALRVSR